MGDNSSAITDAVDNTTPTVAPSASEGADSSDFVNKGEEEIFIWYSTLLILNLVYLAYGLPI